MRAEVLTGLPLTSPRFSPAGIGTFPSRGLGGLPGFQRASPSTPLDVAVYVAANIPARPLRQTATGWARTVASTVCWRNLSASDPTMTERDEPTDAEPSEAQAAPQRRVAPSSSPPPEPRRAQAERRDDRRPRACAGSTSSARRRSRWRWLEEHFDFHALDLEDVLSRNQRPKIDEYDDYLFIVLHFPVFDRAVGRLNAGELDIFVGPDFLVTIPNQPLQPVEYLFERCRAKEELREQLFSQGLRLPALPDRRRRLRLLLPDAAQDRQQARRDRGRHLRGALRGGRPRHLQRQAGDHQLPQGDPPAAAGAARPRERQAAASSPPTSTSRSTSTTSSTPTSGSGTCSRTTRR